MDPRGGGLAGAGEVSGVLGGGMVRGDTVARGGGRGDASAGGGWLDGDGEEGGSELTEGGLGVGGGSAAMGGGDSAVGG